MMKRAVCVVIVVVSCAIMGCTSGHRSKVENRRLIVVSFDGIGADLLQQWNEEEILTVDNGLGRMLETGWVARRMTMVNPTLTSVNHVSLMTGVPPSESGIISNRFRPAGADIMDQVSGFSAPVDTEFLWTAARRQGKRVGILLWPSSDSTAPTRMGDFGIFWPTDPLISSEIVSFVPEQAQSEMEFPANDGVTALSWPLKIDSPAEETPAKEYRIAVLDSSPDGVPRYDQAAIRAEDEMSWSYIGIREWFQIDIKSLNKGDIRPHTYGSWSKILGLDRNTGELKIYRGGFWRLMAYPLSFARDLENNLGFWPGQPDRKMIAQWWLDAEQGIDFDTYLEQAERLDRYINSIAEQTMKRSDFDLLLSYHPIVDEYLHANNIIDPEQWAYSPGKALAAREGLKRVGKRIDQAVAHLWQRSDPDRDTLVVLSDHGLAPLTDTLRINLVLARAGLVDIDEQGESPRIRASSPMVAITSAACAHVYLNLQGREPGGVVAPEEADEYLRRAAQALADITVDGHPVVERIVDKREAIEMGFSHPNSGDLVVFLEPGFTASNGLRGDILEPSRSYAQHGYLNHHPEMDGFLVASGAGIRRHRTARISALDVAPLLASWMEIDFPRAPREH